MVRTGHQPSSRPESGLRLHELHTRHTTARPATAVITPPLQRPAVHILAAHIQLR
jgi:hypothetical protein